MILHDTTDVYEDSVTKPFLFLSLLAYSDKYILLVVCDYMMMQSIHASSVWVLVQSG